MSEQSHGSRVLSGDWPFTFHVPVKNLKKQKWCRADVCRSSIFRNVAFLYQDNKTEDIKELLSPVGLDVHIFILLLTQAVFYEVFSLSCLAGEHSLSHAVGSGAVTPRQRPVHTV